MRKPIIDVSKHNGIIDWEKAAPHIEGAVIRTGYRGYGKAGNITTDSTFKRNETQCKALNIPREYYYFPTDLSQFECMESAIYLLKTLREYSGLPITIWLDSEKSNQYGTGRSDKLDRKDRTNLLLSLRTYINMIEPDWKIGIYASQSWFYDNLEYARLKQAQTPIWCAKWGQTLPDILCDMWQYASTGSIPGIGGRVDFSTRLYNEAYYPC